MIRRTKKDMRQKTAVRFLRSLAGAAAVFCLLAAVSGGEAAARERTAGEEETVAQEETAGQEEVVAQEETAAGKETAEQEEAYGFPDMEPPRIEGLTFEKKVDFTYAQAVDIFEYEGGYRFFEVYDSGEYLLVPQDAPVPEGVGSAVKIIRGPLRKVYMAATSAMALVNAIGGLDRIRFSSLTADNWYVEEAKMALKEGRMVFAGKYSEPDFELLLSEGCDLAVESTMILHTPKVREMLEKLGMPVFIDRSSYETHPLGRTEWVKVYGALLGQEQEAEDFFKEQMELIGELKQTEDTGKTVAFFSMHSNGTVVVRRTADYVPKMIELAGGRYAMGEFSALQEAKRSSVNITMEEFYNAAAGADYIVYNGTIETPIKTIAELTDKNPLFSQFKAVKEGNIWCADKYLYQATDIAGQLIVDFTHMLTDEDESKMTFLYKCR